MYNFLFFLFAFTFVLYIIYYNITLYAWCSGTFGPIYPLQGVEIELIIFALEEHQKLTKKMLLKAAFLISWCQLSGLYIITNSADYYCTDLSH